MSEEHAEDDVVESSIAERMLTKTKKFLSHGLTPIKLAEMQVKQMTF